MLLAVVNQFSELLAHRLDIMKTRQRLDLFKYKIHLDLLVQHGVRISPLRAPC